MIDYKDKVILITGASSGIGKACAFEFGILGATIALTGRNENKLISTSTSFGHIEFYVSDFPQKFNELGGRFFGRKLIDVTHISLL